MKWREKKEGKSELRKSDSCKKGCETVKKKNCIKFQSMTARIINNGFERKWNPWEIQLFSHQNPSLKKTWRKNKEDSWIFNPNRKKKWLRMIAEVHYFLLDHWFRSSSRNSSFFIRIRWSLKLRGARWMHEAKSSRKDFTISKPRMMNDPLSLN